MRRGKNSEFVYIYAKNIKSIFEQMQNKKADLAFVPVYKSNAGKMKAVIDYISRYNLIAINEYDYLVHSNK